MKLRRLVLVLSAIAASIVAVVALGALLVPRMVDSQAIRNRISAQLAKQFAGRLTIGKIELLWWPRPSVVIADAQLSFDENHRASVERLKIYPSLIDLLAARFIVRRALLEGPKVTVHLPEQSEPVNLEELEKQISAGFLRFTKGLPGAIVDLSNGSAEIKVGDKPPVFLEEIRAQTVASPGALRFQLSGSSGLWHSLRIEGTVSPENLASTLDIVVQRLKLNDLLTFFPTKLVESTRSAETSLELKITSVGLRRLKANIAGSAGPVSFIRRGGSTTVDIKRLNSAITYQDNLFQIDVEQLVLDTPQLRASGQLKIEPDSLSANVKVLDLDIAKIRALTPETKADDIEKLLRYLPAGKIPEVTFQSNGRSFTEMTSSKNMILSATLRDGEIVLPDHQLRFTDVAGSVRLDKGVLDAQAITASLGSAKAWNGKLRFGFNRKPSPFHLDIMVRTGAPELHAVLLKLVHDPVARAELLKLRHVAGELSGRLTLGETIDVLAPIVAISEAKISADYQPVPFPIVISRGRLKYDRSVIQLENAQASVGRSSFNDLDVTWHRDGSGKVSVESKRASLDLRQTDVELRKFRALSAPLEKLKSISGQLNLRNLSLRGPYEDPSQWTFVSAGTLKQVEIRHADFPDRVRLVHAEFEANEHQVMVSDASAMISDASLSRAGGTLEYERAALTRLDVSGAGTVGPRMTQWLSRHVDLPQQLSLRSPLNITAARLGWQAGGDVSLRGQATVADGPRLSFDAVKKPQVLSVPLLSVDDGDQHARFSIELAKDNVDLSFNGELTQQMLDRIFTSFPIKGSSVRGNIRVTAALADPVRFSGSGEISGDDLQIPIGKEQALIEKISVEAHPDSVWIRSAELRWPNSHAAISGKIIPEKKALLLDLDVKGDRLDWQELQKSFGSEAQSEQSRTDTRGFPDIEGTIRLKTDSFVFERFDFSPLETTVNFSPSLISANIDRGDACGITAKGHVEIVNAEIGVDLQLSAKDAPLEPATACLTNQQNDIKGTYSLTARLAGRGNKRELLRALKGNFEFNARNGEFVRSPGIDATFDYLNATGDFKVPFPDLDRETFPYQLISVKGRVESGLLIGDEVFVDSTLIDLTGQGKVDLERKQIDGKGLIAVLKPVDQVIRRLPIINSLLGSTLVGIPVRITGSLDRPDVTYLSPTDVGSELLNIPLRILGLPLGALRLFTPSKDIENNGAK